MKKATIATIAIWALGVSAASVLVYTLTRPLSSPVAQVASAPAQSEPTPPAPAEEPPAVITLDTVEIAGSRPHTHGRAAATARARRWRDLSEMRCSDWRALAMGPVDRGVRYCE